MSTSSSAASSPTQVRKRVSFTDDSICAFDKHDPPAQLLHWRISKHPVISQPTFNHYVKLLAVKLSNANLVATISIKNLDFTKAVKVRYSFDNWATFSEDSAWFESKTYNGNDLFTYTWDCAKMEEKPRDLVFCVNYKISETVYWDNNNGSNYKLSLTPPTEAPVRSPITKASIVVGKTIPQLKIAKTAEPVPMPEPTRSRTIASSASPSASIPKPSVPAVVAPSSSPICVAAVKPFIVTPSSPVCVLARRRSSLTPPAFPETYTLSANYFAKQDIPLYASPKTSLLTHPSQADTVHKHVRSASVPIASSSPTSCLSELGYYLDNMSPRFAAELY